MPESKRRKVVFTADEEMCAAGSVRKWRRLRDMAERAAVAFPLVEKREVSAAAYHAHLMEQVMNQKQLASQNHHLHSASFGHLSRACGVCSVPATTHATNNSPNTNDISSLQHISIPL